MDIIKINQQGNANIENFTFEKFVRSIKNNIRQYTMIIALIVIWISFTILTKGLFIQTRNLSTLFLQCCSTAILASGMVLIMVAGHIDLSVGRLAGFCGAVSAFLQVKLNMGTLPAILLTLIVGVLVGLWQGFWVAYRGVPAFIVTLSSMLIFQGNILGVTGGNTLGPMKESFGSIGNGYLPNLFISSKNFNDFSAIIGIVFIAIYIAIEIRRRKSRIKYGFTVLSMKLQILKMLIMSIVIGAVFSIMITYMGIPYSIILLIFIVIVLTILASNTAVGRHIYAIGGNKEAAQLSGINTKKVNLYIFVIMGVLSAVGGIVMTGRLNAATTSAGQNMELDAISSAVIGGTSSMGGEGRIFGAIIGALVMASLDNGMSLMDWDIMYQYIIKGLILLFAVWIDVAIRRKKL